MGLHVKFKSVIHYYLFICYVCNYQINMMQQQNFFNQTINTISIAYLIRSLNARFIVLCFANWFSSINMHVLH
jgi:hypothetical protein